MIRFMHTLYPNKKAIKYLDDAIKRTPGNVTKLETVLSNIKNKNGDLFLIEEDCRTIGIVYMIYYRENKILCPVLVGGIERKKWQPELQVFLVNMATNIKAKTIQFVARKGWKKLYPVCRDIGTVYELKVGSSDK